MEMSEFPDHYKTLGVSINVKTKELNKAYRRLALAWHPDKHRDKDSAEKKFIHILEAYEFLKDEKKRRSYDAQYRERNRRRENERKRSRKVQDLKDKLRRRERKHTHPETDPEWRQKRQKELTRKRIQQEMARLQREMEGEQAKRAKKEMTERKDKKLQMSSVEAVWGKEEKPFTDKDLRSIFGIYGKVLKVQVATDVRKATIVFEDPKAAIKACADEEDLNDFGLLVTFLGDKMEKKRHEQARMWRNIRPEGVSHEEYERITLAAMRNAQRNKANVNEEDMEMD